LLGLHGVLTTVDLLSVCSGKATGCGLGSLSGDSRGPILEKIGRPLEKIGRAGHEKRANICALERLGEP